MPKTRKWVQWSRSIRKDTDATGGEIPRVSFDPEIADLLCHAVLLSERAIDKMSGD